MQLTREEINLHYAACKANLVGTKTRSQKCSLCAASWYNDTKILCITKYNGYKSSLFFKFFSSCRLMQQHKTNLLSPKLLVLTIYGYDLPTCIFVVPCCFGVLPSLCLCGIFFFGLLTVYMCQGELYGSHIQVLIFFSHPH